MLSATTSTTATSLRPRNRAYMLVFEGGMFSATTATSLRPRNRAYVLVFEGGMLSATTTTTPTSRRRAYVLVFEGGVLSATTFTCVTISRLYKLSHLLTIKYLFAYKLMFIVLQPMGIKNIEPTTRCRIWCTSHRK